MVYRLESVFPITSEHVRRVKHIDGTHKLTKKTVNLGKDERSWIIVVTKLFSDSTELLPSMVLAVSIPFPARRLEVKN